MIDRIKIKGRKSKPVTGPDLGVTFSLPIGLTDEQHAQAIVAFLGGVTNLAQELGAAWVRLSAPIPEEYRDQVEAIAERARNPAGLKVVVDNAPLSRQSQE